MRIRSIVEFDLVCMLIMLSGIIYYAIWASCGRLSVCIIFQIHLPNDLVYLYGEPSIKLTLSVIFFAELITIKLKLL